MSVCVWLLSLCVDWFTIMPVCVCVRCLSVHPSALMWSIIWVCVCVWSHFCDPSRRQCSAAARLADCLWTLTSLRKVCNNLSYNSIKKKPVSAAPHLRSIEKICPLQIISHRFSLRVDMLCYRDDRCAPSAWCKLTSRLSGGGFINRIHYLEEDS